MVVKNKSAGRRPRVIAKKVKQHRPLTLHRSSVSHTLKCAFKTQTGKQCSRRTSKNPGDDKRYCFQHQRLVRKSASRRKYGGQEDVLDLQPSSRYSDEVLEELSERFERASTAPSKPIREGSSMESHFSNINIPENISLNMGLFPPGSPERINYMAGVICQMLRHLNLYFSDMAKRKSPAYKQKHPESAEILAFASTLRKYIQPYEVVTPMKRIITEFAVDHIYFQTASGFTYFLTYISYLIQKLIISTHYTIPMSKYTEYIIFVVAFVILDVYSEEERYSFEDFSNIFKVSKQDLIQMIGFFSASIKFYIPSALSDMMEKQCQLMF